jgi:hypothetical protein
MLNRWVLVKHNNFKVVQNLSSLFSFSQASKKLICPPFSPAGVQTEIKSHIRYSFQYRIYAIAATNNFIFVSLARLVRAGDDHGRTTLCETGMSHFT